MVVVTGRDVLAQREYFNDQIRAAQQYRLMREAGLSRREAQRFHARALAWLGGRLYDWGRNLERRFGRLVPSMGESIN